MNDRKEQGYKLLFVLFLGGNAMQETDWNKFTFLSSSLFRFVL